MWKIIWIHNEAKGLELNNIYNMKIITENQVNQYVLNMKTATINIRDKISCLKRIIKNKTESCS